MAQISMYALKYFVRNLMHRRRVCRVKVALFGVSLDFASRPIVLSFFIDTYDQELQGGVELYAYDKKV